MIRNEYRLEQSNPIEESYGRAYNSGDEFPAGIGPQCLPPINLKVFEQIRFNHSGDLFDINSVIEDCFPSKAAFENRDIDRFERRFKRLYENPDLFEGAYLWITDQYSHFYYHWFCDALPRLAASIVNEKCQIRRLLLPRRVYDKQFVRDSLRYWPEVELVVPPEVGRSGIAEQLHVTSRVNETPMVHTELIGAVIERYRSRTGQLQTDKSGKRIYISRKNARARRIVNEPEFAPVLERHGFETVVMEELSLDDQVDLMRQADTLAGAHGGGLTNMIFLRPKVPVLELRRELGPPPCFYNLARACMRPWHMLACDPVDKDWHYHSANIVVDPLELDAKLSAIASKPN